LGNVRAALKSAELAGQLIEHGAPLEAVAEGETPLLGAIKVSRFDSARVLLAKRWRKVR
jgi:hypothetical protein